MKTIAKCIILLFCVLSLNTSIAQTYKTLPDSNAVWMAYGAHSEGGSYYYFNIDNHLNDTIIQGETYIKLFFESEYIGAYRSESTGKTYYCPRNSVNKLLIHDFSAQEGDTIFGVSIQTNNWDYHYEDDLIVDSVRYYPHGNDSIKVIALRCPNSWWGGLIFWIEGVGTLTGFFNLVLDLVSYNLVCFSSNDTIQFYTTSTDGGWYFNPNWLTNTAGSCWQYLDIGKENEEKTITLYPNPFSQSLTIETSEIFENVQISIYDMFGRRVFQMSLDDLPHQFTLDLPFLPSGNYILKINTQNELLYKQIISKI
jgi:hypothetical protein